MEHKFEDGEIVSAGAHASFAGIPSNEKTLDGKGEPAEPQIKC